MNGEPDSHELDAAGDRIRRNFLERLREQPLITHREAQAIVRDLGEQTKARLPAGTDFVLVLDAPVARAYESNFDRGQVVRVTREFLLTLGGVDCVPPTVG